LSSGDPRSSTGIRQKLFTAVVDNRATSIFCDAWVVIVGIVEPLFSDDLQSSQGTAYRDILDLLERGAPLLVEIEWTLMAFARMRALDGLLPVQEPEPDEPKRVLTTE
jgi:hypothetical protein